MGDLKYTPMVGDAGSSNIKKSSDLEDLFDDFMAQAKGILGSDWAGYAAGEFERAHHEWNAQLVQYASTRAQFGQAVIKAMENAFNADQQAGRFFA
ncbi:hypothetical protein [Amycolatopsis thermophila]|uniref:Uncharacterized protein YukE n=1 Tax=Amycolatopsis thermophila TaxID=206084 RepID=A0ABU0ELI4_9PSEU|nr:hypothetical protein [Amycolatopsis thermophila]MDQ0376145.1 uncharacterized protein YukE [Amycolatopsis thermophila]